MVQCTQASTGALADSYPQQGLAEQIRILR